MNHGGASGPRPVSRGLGPFLQTEQLMPQRILIEPEVPGELALCRLPAGLQQRLQELLDRQDRGDGLTEVERQEAAGLVDLAEFLSLLRLRAERSA
jgi:hypothetical protein